MRLKVVTYNVHKCIGGIDRKYRPERIRDAVAPLEADFALLQEVDDGAARSNRHRQVDLLGEFLGFRHRAFFPNVRVRGGGWYGNAILSRFPIVEARNIDLSLPLSRRRSVLYARVRVTRRGRSRTVVLFNMHLGLSQFLRARQLAKFLASPPLRGSHSRAPVVLAGDFNDVWGTLGPRYLVPAGFRGTDSPQWTFPAWAPVRALDGVYVRGDAELLAVRRSTTPAARRASDHLPLVAEVHLK